MRKALRPRSSWCDIAAIKASESKRLEALGQDSYAALKLIRAAMHRNDVLVNDQSILNYWASAFFPVLEPGTFLYPSGSGTLGYALPAAIGAACAVKRSGEARKIVCIAGDGGFQYTQHELATLAQYDLPVKILLVNDDSYGVIAFLQRTMFGQTHEIALKNPDFCRVAEAYGIRAERITSVAALQQRMPRLAQRAGSCFAGVAHPVESAVGSWRYPAPNRHRPEKLIMFRASFKEIDRLCLTSQPTESVKQLFDLTGRVAIITGGSIGLGRQMAEALAEMGANLVLCARKKERCEEAAHDMENLGVRALAMACDVKDQASVEQLIAGTMAEFKRIDILINNAGISWGAPTEKMTLAEWNKVMETNLTGTFLCAQAAGKIMLKQESGKIINMASVAGIRGAPPETVEAIAYHASKGGVISFTHDLAVKWARHNIQVNAIAPGWFPTHMSDKVIEHKRDYLLSHIPARRFGSDYDLKGAAVFLASDASAYVNGHVLVVDGGQSA